MRSLTLEDKINAFKSAVHGFSGSRERWAQRSGAHMSNADLEDVLRYELGIAGGSSAYGDTPCIHFQRSGLKIWASWESFIPQSTIPIFQGKSTIQMARQIFDIKEFGDTQLPLF